MTLTDVEYQKLRDLAINIVRAVGVATGGCNIQFAINPNNGRIIVIEMNPRVSRSSALASKATGFPIAKIATLLAIGYSLDEIKNDITRVTPASFEPTLDYVVVKIPRFAFEKFPEADARLTTTMKSVGEAMAIGRSFPESLMKAIRSIEKKGFDFNFLPSGASDSAKEHSVEELLKEIRIPTENRILQVQRALFLGATLEEVFEATKIDRWFLAQIMEINEMAQRLGESSDLPPELLQDAKALGFSDVQIAKILSSNQKFPLGSESEKRSLTISAKEVAQLRERHQIFPVYKTVDTCAAEFMAYTPYYYSSYDFENEVVKREKPAVIILGSGPNRIGQGIEFDYSCVHASFALSKEDFVTVMVNCNPETVSTDYDTSDRLYFEPLTLEDVLEVIRVEKAAGPVLGVITQLGGQTPLGLAKGLAEAGVEILGTDPKAIDLAEERGLFADLLSKNNLSAPAFGMAKTFIQAKEIADQIHYPVLVRPSFVLGGRGMEIVYDDQSLATFLERATEITPDHPVLIDKFLEGAVEIDVDALFDGQELFLGGIMEHIEEAGIHSGDSACVIPTQSISVKMLAEIESATLTLAREIGVRGLINIQFAIADSGAANEKLYVIEANPRASRTVPFVSKATGVNLARAAALISVGNKIAELKNRGVLPSRNIGQARGISVKEAVLPFNRFRRLDGIGVDSVLGPEMKSTGEVMGISSSFGMAYAKSQTAAFGALPKTGCVFITVSDRDKQAALEPAKLLAKLGFTLYATMGTHKYFADAGLHSLLVRKESAEEQFNGSPTPLEIINSGRVNLIINTPLGRGTRHDGWLIRTAATVKGVPLITTISGFKAAANGIREIQDNSYAIRSLQEWQM
jgi:carbamoyl-phosphate synthase large subunit